jgi:FTR1 family protein
MFEAIIITLREGVEAALVLAIALSFLRRRQRLDLAPPLFAGAATALIASIGAAFVVSRLPLNAELTEGIIMLVGAVLVFSLVWFMWRAAPHMKAEVETAVEKASVAGAGAAGMFLFSFGMIFREGLETAVFLSAARFNSEGIGIWIGALIGLAAAGAFGVLFVRGMIRIPLKPFFTVTSAVLMLLGFQLLVGGLHELSEAQVIPSSRTEMAIIGPIVKSELLLFALTIALVAGWLLFAPVETPATTATEGAEGRLARARQSDDRRRRRWTGALGMAVVVVLATAFVQGSRTPARQIGTPLVATDGAVTFDAAPLDDGHPQFFETETAGETVRFFAIRVGDEIRTCFDGCEICGDIGYFQDGGDLVCRNCTSPIPATTLGRSGGCNPVPLPSRAEGGRVIVNEADLASGWPRLKGH